MARTLATLRDQLAAAHYVGKTLEDLRGAPASYDAAIGQLAGPRRGRLRRAPKPSTSGAQQSRLAPIAVFNGMPYRDSDTAGARMTAAGRALLADTREADPPAAR